MMKHKAEKYLEQIKKYFDKNYSYNEICQMIKIKYNYSISRRTLERILHKHQLRRKNVEESPIPEIVAAIDEELEGSGTNLGYQAMAQRLRSQYKLVVKAKTVLNLLRLLDPAGVDNRKKSKLKRRNYQSPGPNAVWHIDNHDKVLPYGFAIHGAIDGYSRKVLWLEVATTNKDPSVVAHYFLSTVRKLGCLPAMIRSDRGTENIIVESLQIRLRTLHHDNLAGSASYLMGKSTQNQRIESFWVQLQRLGTRHYMDIFKQLTESGHLDIKNKIQIECLRYAFGPLIQNDLNCFRKEWNAHRIRKQCNRDFSGGRPNILYGLPQNYGAVNFAKSVDNEHIDILFDKYTSRPRLYSTDFEEIVTDLMPNVKTADCTEQALNLYFDLWDNVSRILQ